MKQKNWILAIGALLVGLLLGGGAMYVFAPRKARISRGGEVEAPGAAEEDEDNDEHEHGVVHLTPEMVASLSLETTAAREGSLTETIELPGEVEWNTDRLVHVSPRVSGVVLSVEKTLGDVVESDELLCVLDSREMATAKMEYLADLGKFAVAEADFERAKLVYENTQKLLAILDKDAAPEEVLAEAHDLPVGDNKNKLLTAYTRMRVNQRNFERTEGLLEKKIASEVDHLEAKGAYDVSRADYFSTYEEISFDLRLKYLRARRDFQLAETELDNSERSSRSSASPPRRSRRSARTPRRWTARSRRTRSTVRSPESSSTGI